MAENRENTNYIEVTGLVLKTSPVGEYDRRTVILTKERGKITAFARGARKQGNALMAPASPLSFGTFRLYASRDSYSLREAQISEFFDPLKQDMENTCYASYFLEVLEYLTRENNDEAMLLLLGYASLRALEKGLLDKRLIRCIFELKAIGLEGEYPGLPADRMYHDAAIHAAEFIQESPIGKLYSFSVSEEILEELIAASKILCRRYFGRSFSSLAVLESLL